MSSPQLRAQLQVELIATGDELLNGTIVDTNSPWLLERLAARGLPVRHQTSVRDRREDIVEALQVASLRSDLVIVSGGLGPTEDDLTAECAAQAAGTPLTLHPPTLEALQARLAKRGLALTENNRRQAMVPTTARVFSNRFGTAPMFEVQIGRARIFFLPGVPRELMGLCEEILFPEIAMLAAAAPLRRVRRLRCYGIAESALDAALTGLPALFPGLQISYRTTLPENHVGLTLIGEEAAELEQRLDAIAVVARQRIGLACFGIDDQTYSEALGELLAARGQTVAVAESLTGGLTFALLTEAAGASRYAKASLACYSDAAKRELLGIPDELLKSHGAVSAEVAEAMAERARSLARTDFGLACTGLAGPEGDGSAQPVGTVFTALSQRGKTSVQRHHFGLDRERNRRFAAYATLDALRLKLLAAPAIPATAPSLWERYQAAFWIFAGALAVFCIFSGPRLGHQSFAPHFVYQADAFLHGQLALRVPPPNYEDWAKVGDLWYVSFPPFPAVVMMPFVALAGFQLNDVLFTVFFAALNVALFYLLLERLRRSDDSARTSRQNVWLALLFAFGTVNFYCSLRGEVWFTAEVLGVTLTCLYLLAAHEARHPALAGLLYGCATLTRTPLIFSAVYFFLELLVPDGIWDPAQLRTRRSEIWQKSLRFLGPMLLVAIPAALMNYARFGSFGDFGHDHLFNNRVNADIERWGLFNYHYLERNLHAAFTRLPVLGSQPGQPPIGFDFNGMSLFVTTPLFWLLLWPAARPRLHRLLWITVALISIPGFFYQNTGWRQFGFRFSLDYTPYLFLLLAIGGRRFGRWFWGLAAAGVAVNVWGAIAFN